MVLKSHGEGAVRGKMSKNGFGHEKYVEKYCCKVYQKHPWTLVN